MRVRRGQLYWVRWVGPAKNGSVLTVGQPFFGPDGGPESWEVMGRDEPVDAGRIEPVAHIPEPSPQFDADREWLEEELDHCYEWAEDYVLTNSGPDDFLDECRTIDRIAAAFGVEPVWEKQGAELARQREGE